MELAILICLIVSILLLAGCMILSAMKFTELLQELAAEREELHLLGSHIDVLITEINNADNVPQPIIDAVQALKTDMEGLDATVTNVTNPPTTPPAGGDNGGQAPDPGTGTDGGGGTPPPGE